jgi:WD40 repeat protein
MFKKVGLLLLLIIWTPNYAQDSSMTATAVAWSGDSQYLAVGLTVSNAYRIEIYDTISNTLTQTFDISGEVMGLAWSASVRYLAARFRSGLGPDLQIWDLEVGSTQIIDELGVTVWDSYPHWSHHHDLVASPKQTQIDVWNPRTNTLEYQLKLPELGTDPIMGMRWSADDQKIYGASEFGQIFVIDVATGEVTQLMKYESAFLTAVAFDPNGQRVAISDVYGMVTVYNLETGALELSMETFTNGEQRVFRQLRWQNESDNLLGFRNDGAMFHWEVDQGRLVSRLATRSERRGSLRDVALSPFGGRLALAWTDRSASRAGDLTVYNGPKQRYTENLTDVIVPAPSFELLSDIQQLCVPESTALTAPSADDGLSDYLETVAGLTDADIPPGCKADLLAVVETLQMQK